jgi:SAM-dependent methyltransferase
MNALGNWAEMPFDDNLAEYDPGRARGDDGGVALSFDDARFAFVSPDDRSPLKWSDGAFVSSEGRRLRTASGRPMLLPARALEFCTQDGLRIPAEKFSDPLLQYLYLGTVKGSGGEPNSPFSDLWYRRHLQRSSLLVSDANGVVVDVGCDDPKLSRSLFPSSAGYIGFDPTFGSRSELSLIAMAEFMPFANQSVDAVSFLTSLDHILDYHAAIDEAHRILKPGGALYLATLIWTHDAELTADNIHFHHFRSFEIDGVLRRFQVESVKRYNWKGNVHRSGAYIKAVKPFEAAG